MDTRVRTKSLTTSFSNRVATMVSPETRQLAELGRQRGWDCAVLGQAPLPNEPVRLDDWLIIPAHQDTSHVPARALSRVQEIFEAGLRPKGFVLVHEAPKALPAPAQDEGTTLRLPVLPLQVRSALKRVSAGLGALAAVLVSVMGVAVLAVAAFAVAAVLLVPVVMVSAVTLDPILVAVTEDGYWIEIDRWDV